MTRPDADRVAPGRLARAVLGLFLGLLLVPGELWAASQRQFTLETMVTEADDIVLGRVVQTEAHWQGEMIMTTTVIDVEDTLKGRPGSRIEITQPGGTAMHPKIGAPVTMTVSTHVAFRPDERVLLFLRAEKPGNLQIVGAHQGKFVVREEPATRRDRLATGPKQLEVTREDDHATVTPNTMALDDMRRKIRDQVEKMGRQRGGTTR